MVSDAVKIVAALLAGAVVLVVSIIAYDHFELKAKEDNIEEKTAKAIRNIFPDAEKIENMDDGTVFKVTNISGEFSGYAFTAKSNGYQSTIKLLAGVSPDLVKILGVEVLASQETPGLGAEITTDRFRAQFKGLSAEGPIECVRGTKPESPRQIQAITGATISSQAVVDAINKKVEILRNSKRYKLSGA